MKNITKLIQPTQKMSRLISSVIVTNLGVIFRKTMDFRVEITPNKYPQLDFDALKSAVEEFVADIDNAYGFYKDSICGFDYLYNLTPDTDKQCFFSPHDPNSGDAKIHHMATQKEVKERNGLEGHNRKRSLQMLIVWIYMLWDHKYQEKFAECLGVAKAEVKSDVFGALRRLRNHVVHCRGIIPTKDHGLSAIHKIEHLSHLKVGDEINFTDDNESVYELIRKTKRYFDELIISVSGNDPKYRTVWRLN